MMRYIRDNPATTLHFTLGTTFALVVHAVWLARGR